MNYISAAGDLRSQTNPWALLSGSSLPANLSIGSGEYPVEASDFGGPMFPNPLFSVIPQEFPANRPHQDAQSAAANVSKWIESFVSTTSAIHSARNAQLAALWARIESFTRKPAGWAGEDSVPVSRETAEYARNLLSALPEDLRVPQATMSAEGEIGLIWVKGSDFLDATIAPDAHLIWTIKRGSEFHEGGIILLSPKSDFQEFFNALTDFYG